MSTNPTKPGGIYSPVLTPFNTDGSPDSDRFVKHCRWLIDQDVGLAIFGTNSEANSLTVGEKHKLLDALIDAKIPVSRLMPGTGACALGDAIELTKHAVQAGCGGVLMLPPFYYKGVSEEGLYRAFATVIDSVADERLRVYLYHIPPVSGVPIPLPLIARLLKAYPKAIAGIKDSSGDWNNTSAMLKEFQPHGFDVFAGSENFLLANMRGGGAGCITATGNVNPGPIVQLYKTWQETSADEQQLQKEQIDAENKRHMADQQFEADQNEKDRQAKIIEAQINAAGRGSGSDVNQNNQSDYLDAMDSIKKEQQYVDTMNFKREQEINK